MKLYHVTKKENLKSILKKGLIAHIGFVYFTPDFAHTFVLKRFRRFIEPDYEESDYVVLEIDSEKLNSKLLGHYREMMCDMFKTADYWHYFGNVPPDAISLIHEQTSEKTLT